MDGFNEYFAEYHEQRRAIKAEYDAARIAGDDARAEIIADELYAIGFEHYQLMNSFRRELPRLAKTHPEVASLLHDLEIMLALHSEESAEALNRYTSRSLGIKL